MPHIEKNVQQLKQNYQKNFALNCDKTKVSSRPAAMIVTAFLNDINSGSPSIIERNKASRERKKLRMQSLESTNYENVINIYFEVRKMER